MKTKYLKALNYYGAKQQLLKYITPYLKINHDLFIEVFGGAGTILLNKRRSKNEIYNDIDSELVNFFRVIRDKQKLENLKNFINNTPYSREEFYYFKKILDKTPLSWERAAKFFYLHMCSFSGIGKYFNVSLKRHPKLLYETADKLNLIRDRFKGVFIENKSFESIFELYDSSKVLYYMDPPYTKESRSNYNYYKYKFEMDSEKQNQFLKEVLKLKGKIIISAYNSKQYDILLEHGFIKKEFKVDVPSKKKKNIPTPKATEVLWLSSHFKIFENRSNLFFKDTIL